MNRINILFIAAFAGFMVSGINAMQTHVNQAKVEQSHKKDGEKVTIWDLAEQPARKSLRDIYREVAWRNDQSQLAAKLADMRAQDVAKAGRQRHLMDFEYVD